MQLFPPAPRSLRNGCSESVTFDILRDTSYPPYPFCFRWENEDAYEVEIVDYH
jgi:hypothetical protein